jgi:hypothetical protein
MSDIIYPLASMTQTNPNSSELSIKSNKIIEETENNKKNKAYSIDYFYDIKNLIRDEIGDLEYFSEYTQSFFEKMTQIIPYNRKKKHHISDEEWRKRKGIQFLKKDNQDQSEKIYQELKGLLNKISPNNYQTILDEINNNLDNYQDKDEYNHYLKLLLTDILKKARMEPAHCVHYIKIIIGLNGKDSVSDFIGDVKEKYSETLEKLTINDSVDLDNIMNNFNNVNIEDETYDEFCVSRKHKNYQKGFSQFVGELFNYQQINMNELISYWQSIVNNLNSILNFLKNHKDLFDNVIKFSHKMIEENILYLSSLIEASIEHLFKIPHIRRYQESVSNIFKNIEELSENKIIPNKNRYLLINLIDIYNTCNQQKKQKYNNNQPNNQVNNQSPQKGGRAFNITTNINNTSNTPSNTNFKNNKPHNNSNSNSNSNNKPHKFNQNYKKK